MPVASQTAWQGLFTHGHLEKGQTILIHGGAGAVGAYAVQLASHADATVIATASGDDEVYLNSIGASRVIDYREAQFEKILREKVGCGFRLGRWRCTEAVVPRLEGRLPSRIRRSARCLRMSAFTPNSSLQNDNSRSLRGLRSCDIGGKCAVTSFNRDLIFHCALPTGRRSSGPPPVLFESAEAPTHLTLLPWLTRR